MEDIKDQHERNEEEAKEVLAKPGVTERITKDARDLQAGVRRAEGVDKKREKQEEKKQEARELKTSALEEMDAELEKFKIFLTGLVREYKEEEARVKSLERVSKEIKTRVDSFISGAGGFLRNFIQDSERSLRGGKTLAEVRADLKEQKTGFGFLGDSREKHKAIAEAIDFLPSLEENIKAEVAHREAYNRFYTGSGWSGWEKLKQSIEALKAKAAEHDERIRKIDPSGIAVHPQTVERDLFKSLKSLLDNEFSGSKHAISRIIQSVRYPNV